MATRFDIEAMGPGEETQSATAVNGIATITLTGVAGQAWVIASGWISQSAAPATAVSFTVNDGVADIERIELPASLIGPVPLRRIVGAAGRTLTLTLPALGSGVRGTISVSAQKVSAQ